MHEAWRRTGRQAWQIVNLADFCNECGNCESFCPSADRPWADKPRLALSEQAALENPGAYRLTPAGLSRYASSLIREQDLLRFTATGVELTLSWPEFTVSRVHITGEERALDLSDLSEMLQLYSLVEGGYLMTAARTMR